MSAPSFTSCKLFLPCKNLLVCSFAQNVTFDGINAYSRVRTLGCIKCTGKATESTKHTTQWLQAHSTKTRTMVTKRETRHNSKYPSDVAVVILVSNETHWWMLPIIVILSTILYGKCLPARLLLLARPSWLCISPRPEADRKITKLRIMLTTRPSWKSPQAILSQCLCL